MSGIHIAARDIAGLNSTSRLVLQDDGFVKKSGGLFSTASVKQENRAQLDGFKAILQGDKRLSKVEGAVDAACAAIDEARAKGQPLTGRLMAKAYAAGDAQLARFEAAKAAFDATPEGQKQLFLEKAIGLARSGAMLQDAVNRASGGAVAQLSTTASKAAIDQIKAIVIDEIRQQVQDQHEKGTLDAPKFGNVDRMLQAAVAARIKDIVALAVRPATDFVTLPSNAAARLAPTLDLLHEVSTRRMEARQFASAWSHDQHEQQVMRDMGTKLQAMDNRALLELYRSSLSPDMLEFRLMLAYRPTDDHMAQQLLSDLNSWEGMVHMELAERSLSPTDAVAGPQLESPITGRQMGVLADVEKHSAHRELDYQSDAYLRGDSGAARSHDPKAVQALAGKSVTVDQVQKLVRESELTVNLWSSLFEPGGPLIDKHGAARAGDARLKNVFDLPVGTKGPMYLARRQAIEHGGMPLLAKHDQSGVQGADHPISAALNPGRNLVGGGFKGGYGDAFLVLKDSVKERATYTATDSFFAYEASATPERISAMKREIQEVLDNGSAALGDNALRGLKAKPEHLGEVFKRLDALAGQSFGIGHPRTLESIGDELIKGLDGLNTGDAEALYTIATRNLIDPQKSSSHVSSFERLGQVLGEVNKNADGIDMAEALGTAAKDPKRVNLSLNGYIEAQVMGGVDLLRDVAEIRYDPEIPDSATRKALEKLSTDYGIKLSPFDATMAKTISRLETDESIKADFNGLPPSITDKQVKSLKDFREGVLPGIMDHYAQHEQSFDPTGIHGREHISRALLYSNILANIFREQGATVNSDVLYTTVACHDAGRQGNGPDKWEGDSANIAKQHYESRGITDADFLKKTTACIDSQAKGPVKTLEGGILKSADSLDIIRVYGRDQYRTDLLWFMNRDTRVGEGQYVQADHALRDKLIDEIDSFIKATEQVSPSEARMVEVNQELNQLRKTQDALRADLRGDGFSDGQIMQNPQMRVLQQQIDEREDAIVNLQRQVPGEHQAMNARMTSEQIFARIENELLNHPEKYPTMHKYYDPAT